jgi:phage shock protein A
MARQYVRKGQGATKKELAKVTARVPHKLTVRVARLEKSMELNTKSMKELKTQVATLQRTVNNLRQGIPPINAVGSMMAGSPARTGAPMKLDDLIADDDDV